MWGIGLHLLVIFYLSHPQIAQRIGLDRALVSFHGD